VAQSVIHIEPQKKQALLIELFGDPALKRTLVFTRTKRGADKVARHLGAAGIPVAAIHGNKSQRQRENALADFRNGRIRGLIATDIAARGIDIDEVTHVVNYELPNIPESYVHRIGRTARAGAEGIAISLCAGEENAYLRDIERVTRQQIPASDRRGDTNLVVAPTLGGEKPERDRSASRGRMGNSRGERGPFAGGRDADSKGRNGRNRRRPDRQGEGFAARGESRRDEQGAGERRTADGAARDSRRNGSDQNGAGRPQEGRRPEARNSTGERNEARRSDHRSAEGRRNGPRQDDRRDEARNGEHRRGDGRRNDQRQSGGHRADGQRNETRGASGRQHEGRRNDTGAGQKQGQQARQRSKPRGGGGAFAGLPRGTAASH